MVEVSVDGEDKKGNRLNMGIDEGKIFKNCRSCLNFNRAVGNWIYCRVYGTIRPKSVKNCERGIK